MGIGKKKAILIAAMLLILLAVNSNTAYANDLEDLVVICEEIE